MVVRWQEDLGDETVYLWEAARAAGAGLGTQTSC